VQHYKSGGRSDDAATIPHVADPVYLIPAALCCLVPRPEIFTDSVYNTMIATQPTEITSPSLDSLPSPVTPSVLSQCQSYNSDTSASSVPSTSSDKMATTSKRYPAHLSRGSPPPRFADQQTLKRRPNSGQYETMEDLLAAAGYSVTRVFTPDTERVQRLAQDNEQMPSQKPVENVGGIGTRVAGWFAHIMPAGAGTGAIPSRRHVQTSEVRVEVVEDPEANPFLQPKSSAGTVLGGRQYPQATRSVSLSIALCRSVCYWLLASLVSKPG
jgi:hypothetical protein